MKTLEQKVILYDDVCPLCQVYTAGFTRLGWLRHRQGFAHASPHLLKKINLDRARHEIPLHDLTTGETVYGLDALFLILGTRFPVLHFLFRWPPFQFVLRGVYNFISYNRRIIAGTHPPKTGFDCGPDVHPFYRKLYIGMALGASVLLSVPLVQDMTATLTGALAGTGIAGFMGAMLAVGSFVRDRLTFMGHWVTILLITILLGRAFPNHDLSWLVMAFSTVFLWWRRWSLSVA